MILSDTAIKAALASGELVVKPEPKEKQFQPVSLDVHLGDELLVWDGNIFTTGDELENDKVLDGVPGYRRGFNVYTRWSYSYPLVSLRDPKPIHEKYKKVPTSGFILHPGDFVLGCTQEYVELGPQLVAFLDGRSTTARMGLLIHVTAGLADPGFKGQITLEIKNLENFAIELAPGIGIGQLVLHRVADKVENPYGSTALGSKYAEPQLGPVAPRLRKDL